MSDESDEVTDLSITLRDLFAGKLSYRVINRVCLGVARNVQDRTGVQKRPHDVSVAELLQCSAWELITVEGIGRRAWRLFADEMSKLDLKLNNRPSQLETLTHASIAVEQLIAGGALSTTARARAMSFLKTQEQLLYQLDYESRRTFGSQS